MILIDLKKLIPFFFCSFLCLAKNQVFLPVSGLNVKIDKDWKSIDFKDLIPYSQTEFIYQHQKTKAQRSISSVWLDRNSKIQMKERCESEFKSLKGKYINVIRYQGKIKKDWSCLFSYEDKNQQYFMAFKLLNRKITKNLEKKVMTIALEHSPKKSKIKIAPFKSWIESI